MASQFIEASSFFLRYNSPGPPYEVSDAAVLSDVIVACWHGHVNHRTGISQRLFPPAFSKALNAVAGIVDAKVPLATEIFELARFGLTRVKQCEATRDRE